jgi:hypothetical protein
MEFWLSATGAPDDVVMVGFLLIGFLLLGTFGDKLERVADQV